MERIKIEVKQKHIKNGLIKNSSLCPIALAIKEKFHDDNYIMAYYYGAYVKGKLYEYSRKANSFINNFDNGMKVKPFSFYLRRRVSKYILRE